ncbi:MAG: calcium/sodium antiporter [Pseudoxanthomonas sp.]|nr:calcium/sodium antiporter [Pseudoxanthomonas sp.]
MISLLWFLLGLVLLVAGAELLVRGASRLALAAGVSPLVAGLTVVAFGTSSPELAVSIGAALGGQGDLSLGNVVGSNIFNVLFILGLSALVVPLVVARQLVRLDVPLMVALSVLVLVLAHDGRIGRLDGALLASLLAIYLVFLVGRSRREAQFDGTAAPAAGVDAGGRAAGWPWQLAMVVAGLVLLVLGARWLVDAAVAFALLMGVSELVVGLTIVAAGTSLPELVTSVVAALRGERDIAVGNVVGSNLFNLAGVLGAAALVAPGGIAVSGPAIAFDLPVMVVVAFACLPVFLTGGVISRAEGALFLAYWLAYTVYLVLAASHHDALPEFSAVMLFFAVPLTLLTLLLLALGELRRRHGGAIR